MSAPPAGDAKTFTAQKLALTDMIRRDKDKRLSGSIKSVGAEILSLANFATGYAWASEAYLAQEVGVSPRTVKMAVAALKATGYIIVEKVGRNNRYVPNFAALEKGQTLPLFEGQQGQSLPLSDADRGKNRHEQGQKTTADRGKKRPPISLEISLGISSRAEAAAGGAAPDGAAGLSYDLGPPGVLLRRRLGDAVFASWLGKVAFVSIEGSELTLAAPTKFIADYLKQHHEDAILDAWRLERGGIDRLRVTVVQPAATPISQRPVALDDPDFVWMAERGILIVSVSVREKRERAVDRVEAWLKRCDQRAGELRAILEAAARLDISGPQFVNAVNARVAALRKADQPALRLPPVGLKRSAS